MTSHSVQQQPPKQSRFPTDAVNAANDRHEHARASQQPEALTEDGPGRNDPVAQLADALRTAERAHRAYLAELRLGDVEPVEHWTTWYAEYLLGLR